MKKTELYPATINEHEKIPFFHNIPAPVLEAVFQKKNEQPPIFLFSVDNAYVSPYGIVFKNGRVIKESIYHCTSEKTRNAFFSFFKKKLKNKVKRINGDCIVICHSWYQNYYHWMIEIIPRLFLIKDQLSEMSLIIHKNLSKFHHEVLSKFNFKEIIFIEDDELAKCERVYFTSFPNYYSNRFLSLKFEQIKIIELNVNIALMKTIKLWFQKNNPLIQNNINNENQKIYISRKKAGHRKILNEHELETILYTNGFVKVFLEDLSFDEQVQLLNNSAIVVSIHGAGLTNILFMSPHTHIINLISGHHYEFCYLTIAGIADVHYTHINCAGTKKENPAYNDITIDLNSVQTILHSIHSNSI